MARPGAIGGQRVGRGDQPDSQARQVEHGGCRGLGGIGAGAHRDDAGLGQQAPGLREPGLAHVEDVVVRDVDRAHLGRPQDGDGRRIGAEMLPFRGAALAGPRLGDGRFQVGDGGIGGAQQRQHVAPEPFRRAGAQGGADVAPEHHVAEEGDGRGACARRRGTPRAQQGREQRPAQDGQGRRESKRRHGCGRIIPPRRARRQALRDGLARPEGFEPPTHEVEARCSIQLS